MTDSHRLTVAQWADRHGISRQAAYKAVERCQIPLTSGLLDPDVADMLYGKRTRVRARVARSTSGLAVHAGHASAQGADQLPQPASPPSARGSAAGLAEADAWAIPDYQVSRARKEAAEASVAELELAEMRQQLMRSAALEAHLAALLANLREGLMQVGARVAPVLMGSEDAARIQSVVDDEIHAQLEAASERVSTRHAVARSGAPADGAGALTSTKESSHGRR